MTEIKWVCVENQNPEAPCWTKCPPSCVCPAQLLRRSPERRLGAGERDAEEVKKHLFFTVSVGSRRSRFPAEPCELTSMCVFPGRVWTGTGCWPRRWSPRSSPPSRVPTTSATSTTNLHQRLRSWPPRGNPECWAQRSRSCSLTLTTSLTGVSFRRVRTLGPCEPVLLLRGLTGNIRRRPDGASSGAWLEFYICMKKRFYRTSAGSMDVLHHRHRPVWLTLWDDFITDEQFFTCTGCFCSSLTVELQRWKHVTEPASNILTTTAASWLENPQWAWSPPPPPTAPCWL